MKKNQRGYISLSLSIFVPFFKIAILCGGWRSYTFKSLQKTGYPCRKSSGLTPAPCIPLHACAQPSPALRADAKSPIGDL